jgi:tripartite-type tricarboxylate transporter receptor subunit TctC
MKSITGLVALIGLAAFVAPAVGQDYPTKPVRIVAPFAAGGSTDVLTRLVSAKLTERWSHTVIVDNRVGASGNIGAEVVAKLSAPDGYTLLMAGAPHAIGVSLFKNLRYDLEKDLVAIANVATFPSLIVAHPSLPAKNVKELIALAKGRPGELNFGSPNIGSPNHLGMELFATMANVKMVHIPYKGGSGQMVGDLLAGHIQLASMGFPPAIPQVKNGKLRPIAATGVQRSPLLPDVPTVRESGLPGYEVTSWYGLFGPVALSKDIVNRVNRDVVAFLNAPDFKERLATLGAEPAPMTPDEFARYVRADIQKWAKVVKASGAKAE